MVGFGFGLVYLQVKKKGQKNPRKKRNPIGFFEKMTINFSIILFFQIQKSKNFIFQIWCQNRFSLNINEYIDDLLFFTNKICINYLCLF